MNSVWIIEDDSALQSLLALLLESEGYRVTTFSDGSKAIESARTDRPDIALLDIGLPGRNGEEVCRVLCAEKDRDPIPVIVLTGRHDPGDRYRMFSVGADDFLEKPVDNLELVMRVRNKLRRQVSEIQPAVRFLTCGNLSLDLSNHVVVTAGREVALTPSEFAVLRYLVERPGRAVATETLLVEALGYPPRIGNPDTLRTHVRRIRQKLEPDPAQPTLVVNRPFVGYLVAASGPAST